MRKEINETTSADEALRIHRESKSSINEEQNLSSPCPECGGVNGHRNAFCSLLNLSDVLSDDEWKQLVKEEKNTSSHDLNSQRQDVETAYAEQERSRTESAWRCGVCGYTLIKVTTQETCWQQWVCPNVGKNNSLGHDIIPIGYLKPIETKQEAGRQTNRETALNIFVRSCGWLKNKLADNPNAQCGCGSCSLCAYRYFELLPESGNARTELGPDSPASPPDSKYAELTAARDRLLQENEALVAALKALDDRCEEEDGYDRGEIWPERQAARAAIDLVEKGKEQK